LLVIQYLVPGHLANHKKMFHRPDSRRLKIVVFIQNDVKVDVRFFLRWARHRKNLSPISDIRHRQSLVRYRKSICRIDCILARYRIIPISTELNPISVNPISDISTKEKNRPENICPRRLKKIASFVQN
jgi:hypothetical protein